MIKSRMAGTMSQIEEDHKFSKQTSVLPPWIAADGITVIWEQHRILIATVLRHAQFEFLMAMVVIINICLMIFETDYAAQCHPTWTENIEACPYNPDDIPWLYWSNITLLCMYTLEFGLFLYVSRAALFVDGWRWMDLFIVVEGWASVAIGGLMSFVWLRLIRVVRLSRVIRVIVSVRELYVLVVGFAGSCRAIFFGAMLLSLTMSLWSIILVQFIHPVCSNIPWGDCDRCGRGFSSVGNSLLTLFQTIIAGDSWGLIAVPVIEKQPWAAAILVSIVLTVTMGIMSLILAVIVDSAADAREQDAEQRLKAQAKQQFQVKKKLLQICGSMDKDNNGLVSLSEMVDAWDENPAFRRILTLLDITHNQLEQTYNVLDSDQDGRVHYREFVEEIYNLQTLDTRLMLALTKEAIVGCRKDLHVSTSNMLKKSEENTRDLQKLMDRHMLAIEHFVKKVSLDSDDTDVASKVPDLLRETGGKGPNSKDPGVNLFSFGDNAHIETELKSLHRRLFALAEAGPATEDASTFWKEARENLPPLAKKFEANLLNQAGAFQSMSRCLDVVLAMSESSSSIRCSTTSARHEWSKEMWISSDPFTREECAEEPLSLMLQQEVRNEKNQEEVPEIKRERSVL